MTDDKYRDDAERIYLFVQHLGRRLRDFDREVGMSHRRFSALAGLAFEGPTNVGELATFERVKRPAMTRLVQDMERDALVERLTDPHDGRGVRIRITPRGRALVKRVREQKIAFVRAYLETLESVDIAAVRIAFAALNELAEPADENATA
jgi:DNA-binding MarR family transcriptional regulator